MLPCFLSGKNPATANIQHQTVTDIKWQSQTLFLLHDFVQSKIMRSAIKKCFAAKTLAAGKRTCWNA